MTEQHTPSPAPRWRSRAGAIARALTAVGAGVAVGYSTGDLKLGMTTAAVALSLLQEAFARPPR
jgi:hypothetical protein